MANWWDEAQKPQQQQPSSSLPMPPAYQQQMGIQAGLPSLPMPDFSRNPFDHPTPFSQSQSQPAQSSQQADPQQSQEPSLLSDVGNLLKAGYAQTGQGLNWLASQIPGAKSIPSHILDLEGNADYWKRTADEATQAPSKQQQEAGQQKFINDDYSLGPAWSNPRAYLGGVVESIPGTLMGMAIGGPITKGLASVAGAVLPRVGIGAATAEATGAAIPKLTQAATNRVAMASGAVGYGTGEGLVAAATDGVQARDLVLNMDRGELKKSSPLFQDLIKKGYSDEQAHQEVADTIGRQVATRSGVTVAALGAPMGAVFGKWFHSTGGDKLTKSLLGEVGVGMAGEGSQEFVQSGAEQFFQNQAIRQHANPEQTLWQDVFNQAVSGALSGALMGAPFGAAGHVSVQSQQRQQAGSQANAQADRIEALRDQLNLASEQDITKVLQGFDELEKAGNVPKAAAARLIAARQQLQNELALRSTPDALSDPLETARGQAGYLGLSERADELNDGQLHEVASRALPDDAPESFKTAQQRYQSALKARTELNDAVQHFEQNPDAIKGVSKILSEISTGKPLDQGGYEGSADYTISKLSDDALIRYLRAGQALLQNHDEALGKSRTGVEKSVELLGQEAQRRAKGERRDPDTIRLTDIAGKLMALPDKQLEKRVNGLPAEALERLASGLDARSQLEPQAAERAAWLRERATQLRQQASRAWDESTADIATPSETVTDDQGVLWERDQQRQLRRPALAEEVAKLNGTEQRTNTDFTEERNRLRELAQQANTANRQNEIQARESEFRSRQQQDNARNVQEFEQRQALPKPDYAGYEQAVRDQQSAELSARVGLSPDEIAQLSEINSLRARAGLPSLSANDFKAARVDQPGILSGAATAARDLTLADISRPLGQLGSMRLGLAGLLPGPVTANATQTAPTSSLPAPPPASAPSNTIQLQRGQEIILNPNATQGQRSTATPEQQQRLQNLMGERPQRREKQQAAPAPQELPWWERAQGQQSSPGTQENAQPIQEASPNNGRSGTRSTVRQEGGNPAIRSEGLQQGRSEKRNAQEGSAAQGQVTPNANAIQETQASQKPPVELPARSKGQSEARTGTEKTGSKKSLVLWGYKPGVADEPIKISTFTKGEQERWKKEGWKTAVYEVGTEPTGLRDQAKAELASNVSSGQTGGERAPVSTASTQPEISHDQRSQGQAGETGQAQTETPLLNQGKKSPASTGAISTPSERGIKTAFSRAELEGFQSSAGWTEKGGQLLRDESGKVTGRTKWVARSDWWEAYKGSGKGTLAEGEAKAQLQNAIEGKPVSAAGRRLLDFIENYRNEQNQQLSDNGWLLDDVDLQEAGFDDLSAQERATAQLQAEANRDLGEDVADSIFERVSAQHESSTPEQFNAALEAAFNDARQRKSAEGGQSSGQSEPSAPAETGGILKDYSIEEIRAEERRIKQEQDRQAAKDRERDNKAQADKAAKDFKLTGSDRPADVAMAQGQRDLLTEDKEPPRNSIQSGPRRALSIPQARAALIEGLGVGGAETVRNLEASGKLVFEPSDPTGLGAQGYVDRQGVLHLIPANLTSAALSVGLHEGFHIAKDTLFIEGDRALIKLVHAALSVTGLKNFIGNPGYNDLVQQARRMVANGQKDAIRALDKAKRSAPHNVDEEHLAYLVEYAPHLPLVRRILSAIRAALYRMGVKINLTPADIRALAVSALKNYARQSAATPTPAAPRNSAVLANEQKPIPPTETPAQAVQRRIQDKFVRFQIVQDWIKKAGINLTPAADVYGAEELLPKKTAAAVLKARTETLKPLVEEAAKNKWRIKGNDLIDAIAENQPLPTKFKPSIDEFLRAQHASEANAEIAKKNPAFPDGGSGLTNQQAADILAKYKALPDFAAFAALANQFQAITNKTRALLVSSGRIAPATAKTWERMYRHYIPLKGGPEDKAQKTGTGPGISMKETLKQRLGHSLREENVVENIWRDYERALYLNEKKAVTSALKELLQQTDNEAVGTVGKPEKHAVLHQGWYHQVWIEGSPFGAYPSYSDAKAAIAADSQVTGRPVSKYAVRHQLADPSVIYTSRPLLADNEVAHYENGQLIRLQLNDELMARAAKNLGVDAASGLLRAGMQFNRMLSHAYTGYNPEFILSNVARDFTAGFINLTGNFGTGFAVKALKNYPMAVRALWQDLRGNKNALIEQYRAAGGSTGAAYMSDLERIGTDIKQVFQDYQGAAETWKSGDKAGAVRVALYDKLYQWGGRWIEALNSVGENALRVATFKAALDANMTEQKAARAAANVTVNFNRKGEMASTLGGLYLFFNPSVQGTKAMFDALAKGEHRGQAQALAGSLALLALTLAELARGWDDDSERKWRQIPGYVKDRNMLLSVGGDKQLAIPVPYGYGLFWSFGNLLSDMIHGENKDKLGIRLASSLFEQFSPVGNPFAGDEMDIKNIVSMLPTMLKPPVALALNRNEIGRPLMPEAQSWNTAQPDSALKWKSTQGTIYDRIATGINSLTGGNAYQSGAIDVSPESLRYIVRTLTGGVGQFVGDTASLFTVIGSGAIGETEPHEYPILRRFFRESSIQNARSLFNEQAGQVRKAVDAFNAARRAKDAQGIREVVANSRELLMLNYVLESTQKQIKARRQLESAIDISGLSVAEKRRQKDAIEKQEEAIYSRFFDIFEGTTKRKAG